MNNIRKSGRFSFRTNKKYSYSRTNNSFINNKHRSKGNVSLLYDKYIKLAREASTAGDRIQAEYYHQFADHYSRIMSENEIKSVNNEETSNDSDNKSSDNSVSKNVQKDNKSSSEQNISDSEQTSAQEEVDENDNTLEAVSFISQPVSKTTKSKK